MKEKFSFNKYNTDLDKKMRKVHGNSMQQKLVGVAIAVILIVVAAIIIVIMTKNKANEIKEEFQINEMPQINAGQIKEDIKTGVSNVAEDVGKNINEGIHNLLGN